MRALRSAFLCVACAGFASCAPPALPNPPPTGRFYFPGGIQHVAGAGEGTLYVVSTNFDKRYDRGLLTAVALDEVGLPALGGSGSPVALKDLKVGSAGTVELQSFGGELASFRRGDGGVRLFVPSRAEGNPLQYVDADGAALTCPVPAEGRPQDCYTRAPSLIQAANSTGHPRAPAPLGVSVDPSGEVFVTHLQGADSPAGSGQALRTYLVRTFAESPRVEPKLLTEGGDFLELGGGGSHAVAPTPRWLYVTGRYVSSNGGEIIRLVDRTRPGVVRSAGLELVFHALEARGVFVTDAGQAADTRRIFVAARTPDSLLVAQVSRAESETPGLDLVRVVPLPSQPSSVREIPRPGRAPLLAVPCTGAGVLALYDDEAGGLVAQVPVGQQPFDVAVSLRGGGARLFVSDFGDGRVAVVDLPSLAIPSEARLVAHLGERQLCLTTPGDPSCKGATP